MSQTTIDDGFCQNEDAAGRTCQLGREHKTACQYGNSYLPTENQIAMMKDMARVVGIRKFALLGMSDVGSLKALANRGFISLRYVNNRAWDASFTRAGIRLFQDLPR